MNKRNENAVCIYVEAWEKEKEKERERERERERTLTCVKGQRDSKMGFCFGSGGDECKICKGLVFLCSGEPLFLSCPFNC